MANRGGQGQPKSRLDDALVARGLVESRSRARALILANHVLVNGLSVSKAGAVVHADDVILLKSPPRYVSRGGEKLDHALQAFGIIVHDVVAADFGASTGGFTDCLLQHGASRVYAIDVGYGQLAERLRTDPRVIAMDRLNARTLEVLPEPVDLVTIDVSFIGLHLVVPPAKRVLKRDGEIVALVKPQFEAGRAEIGRGGVVRDSTVHRKVLEGMFAIGAQLHLGVAGLTASPLRGPAGNIEFFAHLKPGQPSVAIHAAIDDVLAEAAAK